MELPKNAASVERIAHDSIVLRRAKRGGRDRASTCTCSITERITPFARNILADCCGAGSQRFVTECRQPVSTLAAKINTGSPITPRMPQK